MRYAWALVAVWAVVVVVRRWQAFSAEWERTQALKNPLVKP